MEYWILLVKLTGNTQDHFSADKAGKIGDRVTSSVSNEKAKGKDEEESTGDDKPFQSADFPDNESQADADNYGSEGVDVLYPSSRNNVSVDDEKVFVH